MASQIDVYFALVTSAGGLRDIFGSTLDPRVTIVGSGDPSTPDTRKLKVPAGQYKNLYDFDNDGGFDLAVVESTTAVDIWYQVCLPADGSSAKNTPVWNSISLPAGRFFVFPGSGATTNPVEENHAFDALDTPNGVLDTGEVAGLIWRIGVNNKGAADAAVTFLRRN